MIYTSYYSNYRNFPKIAVLVQISRGIPKDAQCDFKINYFMPSYDLLCDYKSRVISKAEYIYRFKKELLQIPQDKLKCIINKLKSYEGKADVILLCYEGKDKFCHRHIVADFLNFKDNTLNIKEL